MVLKNTAVSNLVHCRVREVDELPVGGGVDGSVLMALGKLMSFQLGEVWMVVS